MRGFFFKFAFRITSGAFDWDVPRNSVARHPYLAYATGRNGELLNLTNMGRWCVLAFLEGMVIFAVTIRCIAGNLYLRPSNDTVYDIDGIGLNDPQGRGGGIYAEGFLLLSCIVISMQMKVLFMGSTANWIILTWWLLSIAGFYTFNYIYSQVESLEWYQLVQFTMDLDVYWLALFIVPVIITMIDYIVEHFHGNFTILRMHVVM